MKPSILCFLLFVGPLSAIKVGTKVESELETSFQSLISNVNSIVNSLKRHHVDRSALPQIQAMEATLMSLLRTHHMTPVMVQFVYQLLRITDTQMKPAILMHLNLTRDELKNSSKYFHECEQTLGSNLQAAKDQVSSLPSLQQNFENCIYQQLTSAQLANGSSGLNSVSWNYVEYQVPLGQVDATLLSNYITGNWSGDQLPAQTTCLQTGTSTQLTTITCNQMADHCKDFIDADSVPQFEVCDAKLPLSVSPNLPSTCGSQSSPCCTNPFASECNKHEHIYGDKGTYYTAMADYWGAMVDVWDRSKADCRTWCKWCQGNQTACPVSSVSSECPGSSPTTTTTTSERPFYPPSQSNCSSLQDSMDFTACGATQDIIHGCDAYNSCYMQNNISFNNVHNRSCSLNGDLDTLRLQYYATLRIECLAYALNTTNGSDFMAAGLEVCRLKTEADYDLSMFRVPDCDAGRPVYIGTYEPSCVAVSSISTYDNCSGTIPYANRYYHNVPNHKPCASSCCQELPNNFVPLNA